MRLSLVFSVASKERVGDDLGPVLVSGFGRLSWVGVDGGLTGRKNRKFD